MPYNFNTLKTATVTSQRKKTNSKYYKTLRFYAAQLILSAVAATGHKLISLVNASVISHRNEHLFCCAQITSSCPAPVSWCLSYDFLLFFSDHTSFDSSVSILYFVWLKDLVWFLYRVLKSPSVSPMYF